MNEQRIAMLEQFIEEEPDNPFNIYALAMEYYDQNTTKSLQLLQNLQSKHSEYLPTYYKLAHLLWEQESWEQADEVFQKGMELAKKQEDQKALSELKSAYLNFEFDRE